MFIGRRLNWVIALLVLATSCGSSRAAEHLSFNMALQPAGSDAALFLSKSKGWLADAGIELKIEEARGSMNSIQMVAAGQFDIGQGEFGPLIVAVDRGAPIVAVAGWARKTDISIFLDKDSPAEHPRDLKGKSVALIANSPWTPVLDAFLKRIGMTRSDFNFMIVDSSALFGTYSSRRADTMMTIGPYVMPIVNPIRPSRTFDAADYGIVSPGTGVLVSRSTLANKKHALTAFMKEQIRAWTYIFDGHKDEAVAAIIKENPDAKLNPAVLRGQIDAYQRYFFTEATANRPIGWQAEPDWNEAIRFFNDAGLLKKPHTPGDFYTNELIDAALQ